MGLLDRIKFITGSMVGKVGGVPGPLTGGGLIPSAQLPPSSSSGAEVFYLAKTGNPLPTLLDTPVVDDGQALSIGAPSIDAKGNIVYLLTSSQVAPVKNPSFEVAGATSDDSANWARDTSNSGGGAGFDSIAAARTGRRNESAIVPGSLQGSGFSPTDGTFYQAVGKQLSASGAGQGVTLGTGQHYVQDRQLIDMSPLTSITVRWAGGAETNSQTYFRVYASDVPEPVFGEDGTTAGIDLLYEVRIDDTGAQGQDGPGSDQQVTVSGITGYRWLIFRVDIDSSGGETDAEIVVYLDNIVLNPVGVQNKVGRAFIPIVAGAWTPIQDQVLSVSTLVENVSAQGAWGARCGMAYRHVGHDSAEGGYVFDWNPFLLSDGTEGDRRPVLRKYLGDGQYDLISDGPVIFPTEGSVNARSLLRLTGGIHGDTHFVGMGMYGTHHQETLTSLAGTQWGVWVETARPGTANLILSGLSGYSTENIT